MREMTEAFAAAVRRFDHLVTAKVEVIDPSTEQVVASTDEGASVHLTVDDAEAVEDRTQKFRGRYTLTLADPDGTLAPLTKGSDPLSNTGGYEVRLYRGFSYLSEAERYLRLGTFDIAQSRTARSASGERSIKLSGADRSRSVSRNHWRVPYATANNAPRVTLIQDIILDRRPDAQFVSIDEDAADTVPRNVWDSDDDPWEVVDRLALGGGLEVYPDDSGLFVIRHVPDPDQDQVSWVFDTGQATLLERIEQASDNEEAFNGWIILGQNSHGALVLGEAYDSDESSPTYAGDPTASPVVPPGRYGLVIGTDTLGTIQTTAQANAAAQAKLNTTKGAPEAVETSGGVHPGLKVSDIVQIVDAPQGLDARYVLDRVSLPVRARGRQSLKTRERRVT